jgi:Protein of unknown function (DUF2516)
VGSPTRAGPYPQPAHSPTRTLVGVSGIGFLSFVIYWAAVAVGLWAVIDCVTRPAGAFPAASKLTKPAWLAITAGATLLLFWSSVLGFFGIIAIVASIVYLVDVRPAVREVSGGGRW